METPVVFWVLGYETAGPPGWGLGKTATVQKDTTPKPKRPPDPEASSPKSLMPFRHPAALRDHDRLMHRGGEVLVEDGELDAHTHQDEGSQDVFQATDSRATDSRIALGRSAPRPPHKALRRRTKRHERAHTQGPPSPANSTPSALSTTSVRASPFGVSVRVAAAASA
eukprot:CAMPEP_0114486286 /NCGR_PEP_ID=MMETSP0109-20121206/135_1 /TAXON_ID=29199 /ORGANISM="Chlorarachnion reptans, Strain CCCM449" /LENGTH=167 /DNA_ID=CAMNT_0001662441 /DNA_START=1534 /DNA_END=2035 /DNA_ORIENTATION=-